MSTDYAHVGDIQSFHNMMDEQEKDPGYKEAISNLTNSMVEEKKKQSLKDDKDAYIDEHKTSINDEDLSMFPRPKTSCKHCYGRGYEGWNETTQEAVLCRCIKNRLFKEFSEDKLLTYKELKAIYNAPRIARGLSVIEDTQEEAEELVAGINAALGKDNKNETITKSIQGTDQEDNNQGTSEGK